MMSLGVSVHYEHICGHNMMLILEIVCLAHHLGMGNY